MFMAIEHLEQILVEHFRCDKQTANIVANLIKDYDMRVEDEYNERCERDRLRMEQGESEPEDFEEVDPSLSKRCIECGALMIYHPGYYSGGVGVDLGVWNPEVWNCSELGCSYTEHGF